MLQSQQKPQHLEQNQSQQKTKNASQEAKVEISQEQSSCCNAERVLSQLKYISVLLLLISVVPFIVGIMGLQISGQNWQGNIPSPLSAVFGVYVAISLILIAHSLYIMYCISYQRDMGVTVSIILFLIALVLIVMTLWGTLTLNDIVQGSDTESKCQNDYSKLWSSSLLDDQNLALNTFCRSGQQCPCSIQSPSSFLPEIDFSASGWDISPGGGLVTNAFLCQNVENADFSNANILTLKFFEGTYNCSGLCAPIGYYLFTDINRGIPTQTGSCYERAVQEVKSALWNITLYPNGACGVVLLVLSILFAYDRHLYMSDESIKSKRLTHKVLSMLPRMPFNEDSIQIMEMSRMHGLDPSTVEGASIIGHMLVYQAQQKMMGQTHNRSFSIAGGQLSREDQHSVIKAPSNISTSPKNIAVLHQQQQQYQQVNNTKTQIKENPNILNNLPLFPSPRGKRANATNEQNVTNVSENMPLFKASKAPVSENKNSLQQFQQKQQNK